MESSIKVSYQWSAEEMLLAHRMHMRYSAQGRKLRRMILGVGLLCLVLGTVNLVRNGTLASGLPFIALAIGCLGVPFFLRRAVLKMYAKKPDRDLVITYELSADGLVCRSEIGSSDLLWRAIRRTTRTPQGFLLYPSDTMFHWLPVRGFGDAADIERFAQLAQSNSQQYDHAG
jgi:hypothetical protein